MNNSEADYGLLDNLARQTVKTDLIEQNWDDMLRVAGSLKLGTVSATEIMRALHRGKNPSTIAKAIGELGKSPKPYIYSIMLMMKPIAVAY